MLKKQTPVIDIDRVEKLAMLRLTDEEKKLFTTQLSSVLTYVTKLNECDTTSVEPTAQVTGLTNVFREDEVDTSRMLSQKEALKNAPASYSGFVKVKIIGAFE